MESHLSRRELALALAAGLIPGRLRAAAGGRRIRLPLRSRVEAFKETGVWEEVRLVREVPFSGVAILICDMWDKHWCRGASARVDEMVRRMAPVVDKARAAGIRIIHAPSDVMEFYKDYPQRKRMLELPQVEPPAPVALPDPKLPIDDSDGGCDTEGDKVVYVWTRQHAGLTIGQDDVISDNGRQVYSFLKHSGIGNLLVMGVHTNMCVLNRTFAIKQMTRWGIRCILVRDLTDTMYDPKDPPQVSHDEGTALVVEHIEKHWCPSTTSAELVSALR